MKRSRILSVLSALILSGGMQIIGAAAVYAQQSDLSAMETTGYNMVLPPTATSVAAAQTQNGYRNWMSIIGNDSSLPVDNASVSYMSGYDTSHFQSVDSFPFTSTYATLSPGQREMAKLLPSNNYIPVSYATGYDSTKTTSPSVILPQVNH